jgi:hypothetical protein
MGMAEVRRIDRAECFGEGSSDLAGVDKSSNCAEKLTLLVKVRRLKHRPCEHELPIYRDALALERGSIEVLRIVDEESPPLGRDKLRHFLDVSVRLGRREDKGGQPNAKRLNLAGERTGVIDDIASAERSAPLLRFGAGRGRDDGQIS